MLATPRHPANWYSQVRKHWRQLGFLYLCALINNCRRCTELWAKVLAKCQSESSPLLETLFHSLHLT